MYSLILNTFRAQLYKNNQKYFNIIVKNNNHNNNYVLSKGYKTNNAPDKLSKIRVSSVYTYTFRSYFPFANHSSKRLFTVSTFNCALSDLKKAKMPEKKPFERLPKTVVPKHYALELKPDLEKFTFAGKTSIDLEVSFVIYNVLCFIFYVYV